MINFSNVEFNKMEVAKNDLILVITETYNFECNICINSVKNYLI
jgi:hypothetical protein